RWELEQEDAWKASEFVRAAWQGDAGKIKKYLLAGIDVNAWNTNQETALTSAARNKQIAVVRLLLKHRKKTGLLVDARNGEGASAAEIAASRRFDEIVDVLVAAGATLDDASVAQRRIRESGLRYKPEDFVDQAAEGQKT